MIGFLLFWQLTVVAEPNSVSQSPTESAVAETVGIETPISWLVPDASTSTASINSNALKDAQKCSKMLKIIPKTNETTAMIDKLIRWDPQIDDDWKTRP